MMNNRVLNQQSNAMGSHPPARSPRVLFFTGTDTDVGKTHVASLAVAELRHSGRCVAAYKPVASGCVERAGERISGDAMSLWEATGRRGDWRAVCPQRFLAPLAPGQAAAEEGRQVDETLLIQGFTSVAAGSEIAIVEGAGGLLSPLSDRSLNSDLAARLGGELVIVAANRLGVIHQVLSTLLAAEALGLPVLGFVLSTTTAVADGSVASNATALRRWTEVPLLAEIPYGGRTTGIDWQLLLDERRVGTAAGSAIRGNRRA